MRYDPRLFVFFVSCFIWSGGSRTHDVQMRLISSEGFSEGAGGTFNTVYLTELLRVGTFSHVHTSKKMAAKIYNKICW